MLMPSKESSPLNPAFAFDASEMRRGVAAASTPTERRDLGHLMLSAGQLRGEWEWLTLAFSNSRVVPGYPLGGWVLIDRCHPVPPL